LVRAAGDKPVRAYCAATVGTGPTGSPAESASTLGTQAAPATEVADEFAQVLTEETAAGRVQQKESDKLAKSLAQLRDQAARGKPDQVRRTADRLADEIARYRRNNTVSAQSADRLTAVLRPLVDPVANGVGPTDPPDGNS
ncbi:FIMAH domain-containing protein, partial [Micromonospora zhanjiangensis]